MQESMDTAVAELLEAKKRRYKLDPDDIQSERGHYFVDMEKLGFRQEGKACLLCGFLRRADGKNKPCRGIVRVGPR